MSSDQLGFGFILAGGATHLLGASFMATVVLRSGVLLGSWAYYISIKFVYLWISFCNNVSFFKSRCLNCWLEFMVNKFWFGTSTEISTISEMAILPFFFFLLCIQTKQYNLHAYLTSTLLPAGNIWERILYSLDWLSTDYVGENGLDLELCVSTSHVQQLHLCTTMIGSAQWSLTPPSPDNYCRS